MNNKKIFAIALLIVAVFCCLAVVSATNNNAGTKPVSFGDSFTLDLPSDTVVTNRTRNLRDDGSLVETIYTVKSTSGNINLRVTTCTGSSLISSADSYAENLINDGGERLDGHGDWIVVNTTKVPSSETPKNYLLTKHDGNCLYTIEGNNLTQIQQISDTFRTK